jgi:hypothetical protein
MKKSVIWTKKKDKIINQAALFRKIKEKIQHVLKIQYITLLPRYIRLISEGVFQFVFMYMDVVFKTLKS